jgi:hypothetical protein
VRHTVDFDHRTNLLKTTAKPPHGVLTPCRSATFDIVS